MAGKSNKSEDLGITVERGKQGERERKRGQAQTDTTVGRDAIAADSAGCSMGRAHTVVVTEAVAGRELRVCGVHAISPSLHDLLLLLRDWASAGRREERACDSEAHQKPGRDGSADGAAIIRRPGSDEMHDTLDCCGRGGKGVQRERVDSSLILPC